MKISRKLNGKEDLVQTDNNNNNINTHTRNQLLLYKNIVRVTRSLVTIEYKFHFFVYQSIGHYLLNFISITIILMVEYKRIRLTIHHHHHHHRHRLCDMSSPPVSFCSPIYPIGTILSCSSK